MRALVDWRWNSWRVMSLAALLRHDSYSVYALTRWHVGAVIVDAHHGSELGIAIPR